MSRPKRDWTHAAALASLCLAAVVVRVAWGQRARRIVLRAGKREYLHYELVDLTLSLRDGALLERWRRSPPSVAILHDGQPVQTVGGLRELPLSFDARRGVFVGRWPCPWNAPPGVYEPALSSQADLGDRLVARPFRIARRKPAALPSGLTVITLESVKPFDQLQVRAPDGAMKGWRGLLDWAEYVHADALWVLGGQTPGESPGEVWMSHNLALIPEMAREAHRRGLKFGVYVECYLTMSKDAKLARYEYAVDVQDGKPFVTRAISLDDRRRPDDVARLLRRFRDIPEVDFLGLDYIRNALGGYELADRFYADMASEVHPPAQWPRLTAKDRVLYFARKKVMRRDLAFIGAWQWWRAHVVGQIVRRIKDQLGDEKPLWAFMLSWGRGWQHGQDAVMLSDAGVDVDALMLYQATRPQFDAFLRDWHAYMHRGDAQLIVGDVIDWPLHQRAADGPRELYRRAVRAIDGIYADGPARGVFFHDLDRALWGDVGRWGARGWLDEARRASLHLKQVTRS